MKHLHKVAVVVLALVLAAAVSAQASGHGKDKPAKTGILLVAFGTSVPAAQAAFDHIDQLVKKAVPDTPVRWAYTSAIIRTKLAKEGKQLDSVATALAKMMDEGFTQVAIQSLHTIHGEEFHDLVVTANAFGRLPEGFEAIAVGNPLLSSQKDIEAVAEALIANGPKARKPGEALVLMGHGTPHPSNSVYAALMYHLQRKDPLVFIGTVEGSPEIGDVVERLKAKKVKKAYLMPFMAVAGDHAINDMAGDEDDSWKSILAKEKIQTEAILKGTAEFDNIAAIWVDHLKEALAKLKHSSVPGCPKSR